MRGETPNTIKSVVNTNRNMRGWKPEHKKLVIDVILVQSRWLQSRHLHKIDDNICMTRHAITCLHFRVHYYVGCTTKAWLSSNIHLVLLLAVGPGMTLTKIALTLASGCYALGRRKMPEIVHVNTPKG